MRALKSLMSQLLLNTSVKVFSGTKTWCGVIKCLVINSYFFYVDFFCLRILPQGAIT